MSETQQHGNEAFLDQLYASWFSRMAANPDYSVDDLRSIFDEWHKPTFEPAGVTYATATVGGVPVIRAQAPGGGRAIIVYCHGGGFVVGSADSHRKLAGHLANHLGSSAIVVDYRRAPEHPFPAAIEDAVAVCDALREQDSDCRLVLAGDSAGGNLAIATALKLRELGRPLPAAIIGFSPWLDMELSGETLDTNDATDLLVKRSVLEGMVALFLGNQSRTEPLASPINADLAGLPPIYVNAGSVETLLSDATRFADRAKAAGVDVTLSVVYGMQHVFPCLAGRSAIADAELAKIAVWFDRVANGQSAA